MENDTDLLLRVRGDKKSRVKDDAHLLLRVIGDKKSRIKMTQTCC